MVITATSVFTLDKSEMVGRTVTVTVLFDLEALLEDADAREELDDAVTLACSEDAERLVEGVAELEGDDELALADVEVAEGTACEDERDIPLHPSATFCAGMPVMPLVPVPFVFTAWPFHTTGQELASSVAGTVVHMRRSWPRTIKPGCVAFPCVMMSLRKCAAFMLMLNAWTWKTIWMMQWTTEKMK